MVLLIDERPEELTYFRRTVAAEVFASSSDQAPAQHTALAELLLAHIRVELECGNDIVVLLDSLTRLARTFNLGSRGTGRSLSGGMDASALVIPRRFFGLARRPKGRCGARRVGHAAGHRADRHRLAHGPAHLRGVQEHRQQRDRAGPGPGRGADLPGHRRTSHRHPQGGAPVRRGRDGGAGPAAPRPGLLPARAGNDTAAAIPRGATPPTPRCCSGPPAGDPVRAGNFSVWGAIRCGAARCDESQHRLARPILLPTPSAPMPGHRLACRYGGPNVGPPSGSSSTVGCTPAS